MKLGARVRLSVGFGEPLHRYVGVDLGTCEAFVAEEFLHHPKISAAIEEVCCRGVSEGVRSARATARFLLELT